VRDGGREEGRKGGKGRVREWRGEGGIGKEWEEGEGETEGRRRNGSYSIHTRFRGVECVITYQVVPFCW